MEALALVGREEASGAGSSGAGTNGNVDHASRQLGDFRLIREIGRGGMGTVFEAEQISMGRRVALKVLPFAALAQDKSLQRFRNEVRAAAAFDHPHIVSVYSVGEERGVHFYAMQLIRGQTLADVIARAAECRAGQIAAADQPIDHRCVTRRRRRSTADDEPPTIDSAVTPPPSTKRRTARGSARPSIRATTAEYFRTAARLGIQAAEALQHAHDQGVLHRDIKPSNLMLDADGKLYVTDFGLARIEADAGMTMTGDIVGTLRYMAPEQALAKRVVIDHRADIYSLGATLYELLTLQPAFGETDRSELLEADRLRGTAAAAEARSPHPGRAGNDRPQGDGQESRRAVPNRPATWPTTSAFLEDRPIKAKPPTLGRAAKWSRRHQVAVLAAVVVLSISTLALAVSSVLDCPRAKYRCGGPQ